MSLECSICEGDLRGHGARCMSVSPDQPRANAGMEGVPIGLDCEKCGKPVTVAFMAHGDSGEALVSEALLDLVKAAGRAVFKDGQPRWCSSCAEIERLKREVSVAHERMRTAEYRESLGQKRLELLETLLGRFLNHHEVAECSHAISACVDLEGQARTLLGTDQ